MSYDPHHLLRRQIKAGRALLAIDQINLANTLGITHAKISRAESGETKSVEVLHEIQRGMEQLGIVFLPSGGVDKTNTHVEVIEGHGCYSALLERISTDRSSETLLIMFSSDQVSPSEVNERYRLIRNKGIVMRQLIMEGDSYIMGDLNEYRTVSEKYFTNVVTLIYGDKVAQVNGDETRIVIYHDPVLAKRERQIFDFFWDHGGVPTLTTADERF